MLSIFMLNVMKLSVYADCHYAECPYAECHYAGCHYIGSHDAECPIFVLPSVVRLNVVVSCVVAASMLSLCIFYDPS